MSEAVEIGLSAVLPFLNSETNDVPVRALDDAIRFPYIRPNFLDAVAQRVDKCIAKADDIKGFPLVELKENLEEFHRLCYANHLAEAMVLLRRIWRTCNAIPGV